MRRSSIRPCRTGTGRRETAVAASTISSPKRADCRGDRSKVMWTQVETGSAITWKYPSCILRGDGTARGSSTPSPSPTTPSRPTPAQKMVHLGKPHEIADRLQGDQRGPRAEHLSRARVDAPQGQGKPQLHAMRQPSDRRQMRGRTRFPISRSRTTPPAWSMRRRPPRSTTISSSICRSRGMDEEEAVALVVNGFCRGRFFSPCRPCRLEFRHGGATARGDQS